MIAPSTIVELEATLKGNFFVLVSAFGTFQKRHFRPYLIILAETVISGD